MVGKCNVDLETGERHKIPHTMSTQHPDNVNIPEWCEGDVISGNVEICEAHFAYETLGCQEVMWDAEGKDVDTRVVRKLLDKYEKYFKTHVLGEDVFLTYRIPNPKIEVAERKVVVESLQNIPVSHDVASLFYKKDTSPIFEVILPFTTSGNELIWLFNYYRKTIASDEEAMLDESTPAKEWVGTFKPKRIQVIPLVEDFNSVLSVDKIVDPYISAIQPKNLRVFIARSDPALNYGLFCATLLSKIALSKLRNLEKNRSVQIHPILGAGSKPFRGHMSPENVESFLHEYRGISTVTIQSAFRYDYPIEQVEQCVTLLNNMLPNGEPINVEPEEEKIVLEILWKCRKQYESEIELLAPLINCISSYVPSRRARKLHIGLFGYSRSVAGTNLPRAITFSAALYTLGLPPEFLGAKVLKDFNEQEWKTIRKHYVNMDHDLRTVGNYVSWENIDMLMESNQKIAELAGMSSERLNAGLAAAKSDLTAAEKELDIKLGPKTLTHRRYENLTNNFLIAFLERENNEARNSLIETAKIRRCLG